MKANVAVATVSGKAYYMIVNELRNKNVPFLSLTPMEPIPVEIKAVITTEKEKHLINHEKVLEYKDGDDPEPIVAEALRIIQGKEYCEKLVIGVDPGEVLGLAVLADGKVIETDNCFSVGQTLEKIRSILRSIQNAPMASISVKIGDGVPSYKEELLLALDNTLPQIVVLESVREAGTSRNLDEAKHRRGLRDMVSAIRIAGRNGQTFQRRKPNDSNS